MTPTPNQAAPHQSWGPPPRGVFVDVLGTLVEPIEDGTHFPSFEDVRFYEGVLDGLFKVTQAGWNLYLIGNVPSVAFGHQSAEAWAAFQTALHAHMATQGIKLTRDYSCIDHPEGVKGQEKDSVYRLPGTGAMHHAAQMDGISLSLSWVLGDRTVDMVTGWRAGCRVAGVQTGDSMGDGEFQVEPELVGRTAAGVLAEIARDMTMLRRIATAG